MRAYMHIFLNLLMPISLVMAIASIIYFSFSYEFTKALRLGILSGVLIGLLISFIGSLPLFVMRKTKPAPSESDTIHENTHVNTKASSSNKKTPIEQNLILLMDKDLAFNVALFSIEDQNLGEATTKETKEKSTITLRTYDETIQIITTALTRHTAQILIKAANNSEELQKIISYIKEKENSFLHY